MSRLKKVWVSPQEPYSISMEYSDPNCCPMSLNTQKFPETPTPQHPLRQTSVLGCMTEEDLRMIRDAIDSVLED